MSQVCLFKVLKYLYWNFSQMRRNFASYFVQCNMFVFTQKYFCVFIANQASSQFFTLIYAKNSNNRSSHQRCSMKKGVLKNFTKFTGKHLRQCCRPETNLSKLINLNDIWLIHYIIITLIFIALIHYITFKKLNNQY